MRYSLEIDYSSSKNGQVDKPNEDFVLVDQQNGICILCDGVTRTHYEGESYPDPSPAAMAARLVASTLHDKVVSGLVASPTEPALILRKAFEQANRKLAEFNAQNFASFDFGANDRAGTCALAALVHDSQVFLAGIGDCTALLVTKDKTHRFGGFANHKLRAAYSAAPTNTQTEQIRSHRNKKSDQFGYGELTGEAAALEFLETQSITVEAGDTLFLFSSGLNYLFERLTPEMIKQPLAEIDKIATQRVIERGEQLDDRTLIRVGFVL